MMEYIILGLFIFAGLVLGLGDIASAIRRLTFDVNLKLPPIKVVQHEHDCGAAEQEGK